jgi:hypothetical protein
MPTSRPSRYALHQWDALKEARIIYQYCRQDPVAQSEWRGLIAFDAEQMDVWIETHVDSARHKESVQAHLEKREICLKEFERLVKKERHGNGNRA